MKRWMAPISFKNPCERILPSSMISFGGSSQDAIIASSTSGIVPSRLVEALERPERFLIVHPLSPPHLLPITELCTAPETSDATLERMKSFLHSIGQNPVHLKKEIPSFALSRILSVLISECFGLIQDGVLAPDDVDPLLTQAFGLRWAVIGPLAAMDLDAAGGIGEYLRKYGGIYRPLRAAEAANPF
ncbi:3-hydroxyacyl-CoA dehydrogenase NAD-binding domain-containing protein [Mesorhizobium sp. M1076]|uniref:3-hydroxyacyl-CoA dehydrogenase NAD-binding domain-containing protein n=1 Tax=Mesorhizobium sp. M1076 TaxID=2957054 RepID=UPI00333DC3C1